MPKDSKNLTPKQKAFAEYYVKLGNAAEAARLAGYSKKTANVVGSQNLTNPNISQYIAELMHPIEKARVADAEEIIEFFTSVMRGDEKDQFGLDVSIADRLKAASELLKRHDAGSRANDSLRKIDILLEEFKDAVKPKTD